MKLAKIIPRTDLRMIDDYSIKHHYASSWDLMEKAAKAFTDEAEHLLAKNSKIAVVCGSGNNGGDGLAIARLLMTNNYNVSAYFLPFSDPTDDCLKNLKQIASINQLTINNAPPTFEEYDFIIDALLGSGLSRPIEGGLAKYVDAINNSKAIIISVDIPSGLFSDQVKESGSIIRSNLCISFQRPKLSFFLPESNKYLEEWKVVDIGLDETYIQEQGYQNYWINEKVIQWVRKRQKFSHKGSYGHALLLAGSLGKMGAAILASRACIRSGVGLLTCRVPGSGIAIMQTSVPEVMLLPDPNLHYISTINEALNYSAIGLGPGIGQHSSTKEAVVSLITKTNLTLVIDADALNILSKFPTYLENLPAHSILTPHPKEFERLVGPWSSSIERLELQRMKSKEWNCIIVLKDAHTIITTPTGKAYFNANGNPGMATGGSGDVLTGIILGLLAQGYSSLESSIIGVYFHGLAGDNAAIKKGQNALIASDIIKHLNISPEND